ncbi:hypothetical protein [Gloeobacter morelensis]|uniref:Uncharacterized protein n=1 Tax=Gloeobacter morelensis MG652769 TaxID=2781736 RepID=A0ABY3PSL8_9CYAN|nr:hypothetical protein [Gloeobacter morelensis]UFP96706.1 hypothetical protein ISF26_11050 [Gloeobacter morelensis MG652769]
MRIALALFSILAFGALMAPVAAQSEKVRDLSTQPATAKKARSKFQSAADQQRQAEKRQLTQQLNADERQLEAGARPGWTLQGAPSPAQKVPRGNNETAVQGNQPDSAVIKGPR